MFIGSLASQLQIITISVFFEPVIIGTILSTITLLVVSKFTSVTKEEIEFHDKISQIPESNFDIKEIAITKRYPYIMVFSGLLLIIFIFVYYYVPVKIL